MKITKSICSAALFAGTVLLSQTVLASDISHAPAALAMLDGTANFGASFGANNMDNTFADQFTFTTGNTNALSSLVSSISETASSGLDITSFDLYGTSGLVAHGTQTGIGKIDQWTLSSSSLGAGAYWLQVSGKLISDTSASYGANLNVSAVPEPATGAMFVVGLAMLGLVRRRSNSAAFRA